MEIEYDVVAIYIHVNQKQVRMKVGVIGDYTLDIFVCKYSYIIYNYVNFIEMKVCVRMQKHATDCSGEFN